MKKKIIFIIISVLIVVSFAIGFSYAYFTVLVVGNDLSSSNLVKSKSLILGFQSLDYITLDSAQPGDSDSFVFTVKNTGKSDVLGYDIYFSKLVNTFINNEVVYEMSCTSSDTVPCSNKTSTPVPTSSALVHTAGSIAVGTTHTYTVTVSFIDTGLLQDYNQDKELFLTISINKQFEYETLVARSGSTSTELFWGYAGSITSLTFESNISVPVGAAASWDVSTNTNGGLMAYIIDDGLGTSTYKLYIQANEDVILANPNSAYLFKDFNKLKTINNLVLFNTGNVTSMQSMFYNCSSFTSIDLSSLKTSKVTDMSSMFYNCNSLLNLNLNSFNTISVTNMSSMFSSCNDMTNLVITNLDTGSVTNMSRMFESCPGLTNLDLSSFNTSNTTNMSYMFDGCRNIIALNLSSFDTSKVTTMYQMFYSCEDLVDLNISSFNTDSLTILTQTFMNCYILETLDLSSFDISLVTITYRMFYDCNNLETIYVSNLWTTTLLTNSIGMFTGCTSLVGAIPFNASVVDKTHANYQTGYLTYKA